MNRSAAPQRLETSLAYSRSAPCVATIVLNWRNTDDTIRSVHSAALSDYPNQRIYVFDNGADAMSRAGLSSLASIATLLESPINLGYTGGNNAAMRRAQQENVDYFWLLNSDAVVGPGVLSELVVAAEADPRAGIVSPLVRDSEQNSHFEFAGSVADLEKCRIQTTQDPDIGREWQERFSDRCVVVGTAMLVRRALVERIGLLDERLFAYAEDNDYSIRCIRAGFRNRVTFGTEVFHHSKPSIREPHGYYYMNRNAILLWAKFGGKRGKLRATADVALRAFRDLERFGNEHPRQAQAALAGLWDGLLGRTGEFQPNRRMPKAIEWPVRAKPRLFRNLIESL